MDPKEFESQYKLYLNTLTKDFSQQRLSRCLKISNRFNEEFNNLWNRAITIEGLESAMLERGDLQQTFVDSVNAFYQQFYTTLSVYIAVVNHAASKATKEEINMKKAIHSAGHFLDKAKELLGETESLETLIAAYEYRSKFIDHAQQHKVYDYFTLNVNGKGRIIYFRGSDEDGATQFDLGHIMGTAMLSPVKATEWFIPPYHYEVLDALAKFITDFLKSPHKLKQES